ncbi:MAG: hypothetical protein A2Y77_00195 [Planctomycetes bacterium RBG_13_62_9]|nr:MAG: hypothetical protein A2Y77_00195 [Planctomycetes bacterium RBG_13_62_9]
MSRIYHRYEDDLLIRSVEISTWRDGAYVSCGLWRYCDYNEPFDPALFDLEDEVPTDVTRIDLATLDFGLEQNGLTKEQCAVNIVRALFEALIAEDYDKAIKIYGIWHTNPETKPATWECIKNLNVVRIVSIGDPLPPLPMAHMTSLRVPCTIEVQKEGQTVQVQLDQLSASPVLGNSRRWHVYGKINP